MPKKEPQDHKKSFAEILATAKPAERAVTVCLRGDLNSQIEDLERDLKAALAAPIQSLSDTGREREIAERIEALRAEMAEHEIEFRFRALTPKAWSDLNAAHPGRAGKDEAFNVETFPAALISACAVEPDMTPEQVDQLIEVLNNGQFDELFGCAWSVNKKSLDVPFSVLASRVLRESETS